MSSCKQTDIEYDRNLGPAIPYQNKIRNLQNCGIQTQQDTLEQVSAIEYLDGFLDQHLEFKDHIHWVGKK